MAKWIRNREGYVDNTAGIAIQRVSKEERRAVMAKKKSCRLTASENAISEKDVKFQMLQSEYRNNDNFHGYVDRYCKKHGVTLEEALKHELIKQAYLYYTEV